MKLLAASCKMSYTSIERLMHVSNPSDCKLCVTLGLLANSKLLETPAGLLVALGDAVQLSKKECSTLPSVLVKHLRI